MSLTDTFVRQVKQTKPGGDKHSDGQGMYLLVNTAGKYWRFDYRFLGKSTAFVILSPLQMQFSGHAFVEAATGHERTVIRCRFLRPSNPKLIVPATRHLRA